MAELQIGDVVNLTSGEQVNVVKELGRGGQGIVYLVDVRGQQMALKWYINAPDDVFYRNLEHNISSGAPSDAFLWPEYITEHQYGSYGYVMKLRPQNYYEFGQYLLARKRFKSFEALVNAGMKICEGFKALHLSGLSYQDLNDGNFFINPETGDVLICDNDNVMPEGVASGILGKARYMAPEIVTGKNSPNKPSDRYSLSVILFLLFYGNHPLEGSRVLACPCMTENFEKKFYGSEAVFIFDENDTTNRPVRGVHNNVIKRWDAFPSILKEVFKAEFSAEKLQNPSKRMIEADWQRIIQKLRDMLITCPVCKEESFVEDANSPKCMCCGKLMTISGQLSIGNRNILLTPGTKVYIDLDNKPDISVEPGTGSPFPAFLKNATAHKWTVETPSGKLKAVEPNDAMPVKAGLKVSFGGTIKGVII